MLKSVLNAVMERRARTLIQHVEAWLPSDGPVLDIGSGTGHVAAHLERERGLEVITTDVSDIHVVGRPPVLIRDGALPFADGTFASALLFFMLAYPKDPAAVLAEAARVTRGPIIVVQSLHANRFGYGWLRGREFLWTVVAFHVSRFIGYVSRDAKFSMATQRFLTSQNLGRELAAAGLRVRSRLERPVLPGRSLVVAGLLLEPACASDVRDSPRNQGQSPKSGTVPEVRDSPRRQGQSPKSGTVPEIRDSPPSQGQSPKSGTVPEVRDSPRSQGQSPKSGTVPEGRRDE
jgi:SAM-dependent methyltransferase